jgi:hypothetical protein
MRTAARSQRLLTISHLTVLPAAQLFFNPDASTCVRHAMMTSESVQIALECPELPLFLLSLIP